MPKRKIVEAIDFAEHDLRWCWSVLADLRDGAKSPDLGVSLVQFQTKLLKVIQRIERLCQAARVERKIILRDKKKYKKSWCNSRLKTLKSYDDALLHVLALARALGDGFAWIFYEHERSLIGEHLKHQRQKFLPVGIGGLGEQIALERLPIIDGKFLIYHGTTTFLRIGDISLVDLSSFQVAAIGEIKTQKVSENNYTLSIHFLSDEKDMLPRAKAGVANGNSKVELRPEMQARLDRQIDALGKALTDAAKRDREAVLGAMGGFYFDSLEAVVGRCATRRFEYELAGPSMVFGALRQRKGNKLSAILTKDTGRYVKLVEGVEAWANNIVSPDLEQNSLIISVFGAQPDDYILTRQALPITWWPASSQLITDILFGDVMLMTLYNPAHLWDALKKRRFKLEFNKLGALHRAVAEFEEYEMVIENFDELHNLIWRSFMTLESVDRIVDSWLLGVASKAATGGGRVLLDARISRFPPADQ